MNKDQKGEDGGGSTETLFYENAGVKVVDIEPYYTDTNIIIYKDLNYQDGTMQTLDATKSYLT